jgi:hypothetical protein
LDETSCHQPRLVLGHPPLLVLLELEHPLQRDRTVARGQVDELSCPVLLHGLKLLLHGGLPRWFALGFRVVGWLADVREVELGEETRGQALRELVADDDGHRVVAEWLVIVECVEPIFIILQRRGELDLRCARSRCRRWCASELPRSR